MEVQVVDDSPDEVYGNLFCLLSSVSWAMATTMQATYPGAYDRWNEHDWWYMAKEAECSLDVGLETLKNGRHCKVSSH